MKYRGQIDTSNAHIHDRILSWLGTSYSMKGGGVKLALWSDIRETLIFNELCGSKSIATLIKKINLNAKPNIFIWFSSDIKVILDFVPNHTSNESEWFSKSRKLDSEYRDYYVWSDGKFNPQTKKYDVPNNWVSRIET